MTTIYRLPSGNWRVQIRRSRQYRSRTFTIRSEAAAWAGETERSFDPEQKQSARKSLAYNTLLSIHELLQGAENDREREHLINGFEEVYTAWCVTWPG